VEFKPLLESSLAQKHDLTARTLMMMLWELRLQLMERPLLILPQCTVRRRDALV
jgi:hypothetical protein